MGGFWYFSLFSLKEKTLATPSISTLEALNPTVEPTEKALILIGTSAEKVKVLYEIEKDNHIIYCINTACLYLFRLKDMGYKSFCPSSLHSSN